MKKFNVFFDSKMTINEETNTLRSFIYETGQKNLKTYMPSPNTTLYDCYIKLFLALGYYKYTDIHKIYFNLDIFPYTIGYNLGVNPHTLWKIYNQLLNKKKHMNEIAKVYKFKYKRILF